MKDARGLSVFCVVVACAALGGSGLAATHDPPVFVQWHRVGDIRIGESFARVKREFGSPKRYYGHGITLYGAGRRVTDIGFSSRYYRTATGFGVGSMIPTGGSWHGFIWNAINKGRPCRCWVKVGTGKRSLPATGANFGRPWKIVYVRHGRVKSFYFSSHYAD